MKAVAVFPKQPNTMHLAELPTPELKSVPGGRGVRVKVLRVGACGTDKEINAGEYGESPPGSDFLVIGHENFGRVMEVGPKARGFAPGDYVVATVRRPGHSLYDLIGTYDMTTDRNYYERGISRLHGFLTEQYVENPEYLIKVPPELREVAVLLEPCSIVEKGLVQAYTIQKRLLIWRPERALVLGAGPVGLLATMALRLRGMDVVTMARSEPPTRHSELVEAVGAHYLSTQQVSLADAAKDHGPFDVIIEATGYSPIVF
jgi:threonine dehydrogenase-like Zn-dependent dehydrogenase